MSWIYYTLIMHSSKPEAKRITRWITHEVLPMLRRTGSCQMPQSHFGDEEMLQSNGRTVPWLLIFGG